MDDNTWHPEDDEMAHVDPKPHLDRTSRVWLLLILSTYLALTLGYGIVNPLFEAPDEHLHFFAAQSIVESVRLPSTKDPASASAWQVAAHPPLYYLLSALLISPSEAAGAEGRVWMNPRVRWGNTGATDNINTFIHTSSEEWPWSGYALAGHLQRVFSTLLGLGTLVFIYSGLRQIWSPSTLPPLLATALVAFLPQFMFLHASASNDSMIILLCTFALWQLLRIWFHGSSRGRLLALGVTIGLAILSKNAGLLLLPYAIVFVGIVAWRETSGAITWRRIIRNTALVAAPALLISFWLLWRNWTLYGDFTATSEIVRLSGSGQSTSLLEVLRVFTGIWRSSIAVFGWFNVAAPSWIYMFWLGLIGLAVIGAIRLRGRFPTGELQTGKKRRDTLLLASLLAAWPLIIIAGLLLFMRQTPAAQGRLLFPALLPVAFALSYGLYAFRNRWLYLVISLMALATSVYCLVYVIPTAYARPPVIHESEIPAAARRLEADMGSNIRLVAAQPETEETHPGQQVWLTLYWQRDGLAPAEDELRLAEEYVLELFGHESELVGKLQSYHGGGLFPSSLWPTGRVIQDRIGIGLDGEMNAPAAVQLFLRLTGEETVVNLGQVKVTPEKWPEPVDSTLADLTGISLVSAELGQETTIPGETVSIHIRWQVEQAPGRDLTTFVHLGFPDQPPLSQGDSPPLDGHYPTRMWAAGEVIDDSYSFIIPADLPGGRYPILIGMYDPASGVRVPATVAGARQLNDAYQIGWIFIEGREP